LQSENIIDQAWSYIYQRLTAQGAYTRFNGRFLLKARISLPTVGAVSGGTGHDPAALYRGRTLAALRTAKKMQEASRDSLSVTKQDILFRVSEAYFGSLKAQKAVEISNNSLKRMEHHKLVTEREAATRKSKANASALLRANALVSQARINLVRAQDGSQDCQGEVGAPHRNSDGCD
jgi:outer membrane protein TolC